MQGLLVTFHAAASLDELHDGLVELAATIAEVDGLLSKTWIREGERIGAFYIFRDAAAMQAYLDGPIVAEVQQNAVLSDWEVRPMEIVETLSEITRGMPAASAASD